MFLNIKYPEERKSCWSAVDIVPFWIGNVAPDLVAFGAVVECVDAAVLPYTRPAETQPLQGHIDAGGEPRYSDLCGLSNERHLFGHNYRLVDVVYQVLHSEAGGEGAVIFKPHCKVASGCKC